MTSISFESLVFENAILKNQLDTFNYYLAGSAGLTIKVDDVIRGQTIICQKERMHDIVAGLIEQPNSCIDVGPGLRPQRLARSPMHLLVEPHLPYAQELLKRYPEKIVVNSDGIAFLNQALPKSVDTIFILDVIEHLEKDQGTVLVNLAMKVARRQVIIFTPLGFMPQHYSEIGDGWGNVEHNELQNHRSGWTPNELPLNTSVVCHDYHAGGGKVFGAFYSVIHCDEPAKGPRLILVSEDKKDFKFLPNDILIADIGFSELSWLIHEVPKRNLVHVPLQILAESSTQSIDVLRSSILNFRYLESYASLGYETIPLGNSAVVVAKLLAKLNTEVANGVQGA